MYSEEASGQTKNVKVPIGRVDAESRQSTKNASDWYA